MRGLLRGHQKQLAAIEASADWSDQGRTTRATATARSTIRNLAAPARRVHALEIEHRASSDDAVKIAKPDAAEVLVDLALVGYICETAPIPSKLLRESERVRLAAARVPIELTGLKPEVAAAAIGSRVSPDVAVELGEEAAALGAARRVIHGAINELAASAAWSARDLMKAFGPGWQPAGVAQSMADIAVEPADTALAS